MDQEFKVISVIGLGYIGLPTAAMFASRNIQVIGVDINVETVNLINRGEVHIVEPQLESIVRSCVVNGFLRATTTPEPADAFLIAVPTPFEGVSHEPDLSYIRAATKSIASVLKKGDLVILESTSPVGATECMAKWLSELRPDLSFPQDCGNASDIRIAHCPERVLPGNAIRELVSNDRVIGGMSAHCAQKATLLYKNFVEGECIATDARTAEMAKLTENSFRDVNIAFANELSIICDKFNIDVWELIQLANRHPRVNVLQPGPGVGGHCIAVDPWFIVAGAPDEAALIKTARQVNDSKPHWVFEKIRKALDSLSNERSIPYSEISIAFYGLAFKPDIDDLRESPAIQIVKACADSLSAELLVVEPNIKKLPPELDGIQLVGYDQAAKDADVHVLLVDHVEFKNTQPPAGIIVDTKGTWKNNAY